MTSTARTSTHQSRRHVLAVSQAPFEKLQAYERRMGWRVKSLRMAIAAADQAPAAVIT
jgi:predicted dithiol-disulfide oxidoreductase (DUF899 family)